FCSNRLLGSPFVTPDVYFASLIAAASGAVQLLHRPLDRLLHTESVGCLTWRIILQALEVSSEKRAGSRRRPQLLSNELAPLIRISWRVGCYLLSRIHQQVRDVWDTGIGLLIKPVAIVLDSDVHFPSVDADGHEIGLVVVEHFAAGRLLSLTGPVVEVVIAVEV